LTNKPSYAIIKTQRERTRATPKERNLIMYDYNITAAEISAYNADMLAMMGDALPTEEEMAEMAAYYGEE
jgi:hypothetical protein